MTSQNPFLRPARRWPWIATAAVAVVIAVIAIVFAITSGSDDSTEPTTQPPNDPTQSGPPANDELADPLAIISGTKTEQGVSVGYPQNLVGAISAAVEYTSQLTSTLDPDRAEEVAELVVDPNVTDPAEFRQTALSNRESLGLNESESPPEGVGVVVAPVAYQVLQKSDSQVDVLLLGYVTANRPGGEEEQRIGVAAEEMTWNGSDWKYATLDNGQNYDDLAVSLDSPQAKAKGWKALTR